MSRSDRRRKVPAANDNRVAADNREAEDCRDQLLAMPEVGTLDFTTQFVVWALRSWVQAFKASEDFGVATGHAFERFGLKASAAALDGVMTVLAASASRAVEIRCVQCRLLSPDEAILVDAVAAAQDGNFFVATVALRKLMPGTAARSALLNLVDLARDLEAQGLRPQSRAARNPAALETAAAPPMRYLH